MRFAIVSMALVLLTSAMGFVSGSVPGEGISDAELLTIVALQCGATPGTTGQPNCVGGGGTCWPLPCVTGACGANGYGYTCYSPGKPCPSCSGSQHIVCSGGNPNSVNLCYRTTTTGFCCATTGTCTVTTVPDPVLMQIRFTCGCSPAGGVTFDTRTLSTVSYNNSTCNGGS